MFSPAAQYIGLAPLTYEVALIGAGALTVAGVSIYTLLRSSKSRSWQFLIRLLEAGESDELEERTMRPAIRERTEDR